MGLMLGILKTVPELRGLSAFPTDASNPHRNLEPTAAAMLLHAHSGIRYLVIAAALWTIGYAAYGFATGRPWGRGIRITSLVFTALVDLNVVLGFALLFSRPFYPQLVWHIAAMLMAAFLAHLVPLVMRKRPLEKRSYVPYAAGALVVLFLIVFGIVAIGRSVF